MMYCLHCGEKILDGANYCINCAQKVTAPNPLMMNSGINQRAQQRQEELNECYRMLNYFSHKANEYDILDRVQWRLNHQNYNSPTALLVVGIIACLIGLGFLCYSASKGRNYGQDYFILAMINLISGVVLLSIYVIVSIERKNNLERDRKDSEKLINELGQYYMNYGYCLVSIEYTNPSALYSIKTVIESGRADTIKEAINVLNEDAYRQQMAHYASRTAQSAAAAARNSTVIAGFTIANYLKR